MARHGITAKLVVNGKYKGFGEINLDLSGNEVEVKSRGEDYVRYILGQKNLKLDSSAEAGSEGAAEILSAYASGQAVVVTLIGSGQSYGEGGALVTANMIVLNASPSYPVDGEAKIDFSLGLDARDSTSPVIDPTKA